MQKTRIGRRRWRIQDIFNNVKNMDTLCLGFSYFHNSVRKDLGDFFKPKEWFLVYILLRCFHNFLFNPCYEPLLWFMILA